MKNASRRTWIDPAPLAKTVVILLSFGWLGAGYLRLIHWSCRISLDADFFTLPFWAKSVLVSLLYLGGAGFLLGMGVSRPSCRFRERGTSAVVAVALFALVGTTLWARPFRPDCGEVKRRLQQSGVARDAHEGWFGRIKVDEPLFGDFSTSEGKLAWWGKFDKPFEYWGEPHLAASWYDPEGRLVTTIKVDAEKCKLAKAVIKREYIQPGVWRVDIDCNKTTRVDSQTFRVGSQQAQEVRY